MDDGTVLSQARTYFEAVRRKADRACAQVDDARDDLVRVRRRRDGGAGDERAHFHRDGDADVDAEQLDHRGEVRAEQRDAEAPPERERDDELG